MKDLSSCKFNENKSSNPEGTTDLFFSGGNGRGRGSAIFIYKIVTYFTYYYVFLKTTVKLAILYSVQYSSTYGQRCGTEQ
jgi:hypothetical protein